VTAAPALPVEVEQLMRQLKMPYPRTLASELLVTAKAQRWEPVEVVKALLVEEVAGRSRSMLAHRRKAAGFPTGKTFQAWNPDLSSIPAPTQQALRTLEWVGRRENLVVCGPSGTGKTFFLEALGQAVIETGRSVAWFTLEHLGAIVAATPRRRHRHQGRAPDPAGRTGDHRRHRAAAGLPRRRRAPVTATTGQVSRPLTGRSSWPLTPCFTACPAQRLNLAV
jgi:hypothetical protein